MYRTHTCGEISSGNVGGEVTLSGWIHRKRDLGQVIFVDLRDHYGITQCVFEQGHRGFDEIQHIPLESVIKIHGEVKKRSNETINKEIPTGEIEIFVAEMELLSKSDPLPITVNSDRDFPEETRLKYRFLDLRRQHVHANMVLRSRVISFIREEMSRIGFLEFQTPILTASSPEGARDFLVPSRIHPGQFYALPQAPQQFKQLLMLAGFDKYFQVAPCFRDEDARAERSPGEFYQLDIEMSFVNQETVFFTIEPVLYNLFAKFANGRRVSPCPFRRISYQESMLRYGNDKPDLRNPLLIYDATSHCGAMEIFVDAIASGEVIRALHVPGAGALSQKFFKDAGAFAVSMGAKGLGYISFQDGETKGPLAKFCNDNTDIRGIADIQDGDALLFICDKKDVAASISGKLRTYIAEQMSLIDKDQFIFCWVTDFPMYELDDNGKVAFSHNPFSMPQGGMDALLNMNPLDINAYQYDIACNGVELSSGAIRNHLPEIMYKAFEIAGYEKHHVEERFGALLRAFHYGAPPHGGLAPGIDRMVMLLAGEENIREVTLFPMNQQARCLLMNAPCEVSAAQRKELHLK